MTPRRNLWLIPLLVLLTLGCRDSRARVIVDNQSECGAIVVRLTNTRTDEVISERVSNGEKREFVVEPNVFYHYFIDFSTAGITPDGYRCTALEEGRVRVPEGSSQTFTLQSQRQTPMPTPTP